MSNLYNVLKLHQEIESAGIPINGVDSDGKIDFKVEATAEQRTQAETIRNNHVPNWYVDDRKKAYPSIEEQLDMMYHDKLDGTTTWTDAITNIKNLYPKV